MINLNGIAWSVSFTQYYNLLSEEGKSSPSRFSVYNYYEIAESHFRVAREALKTFRDDNGSPVYGNQKLKPTSLRANYELACLVTTLLLNFPSLNEVIKNDNKTTDEDKRILTMAYESWKQNIKNIHGLLGNPALGIKKEEPTE